MFYEIKKRLQIDLFSSKMVVIDEGGHTGHLVVSHLVPKF